MLGVPRRDLRQRHWCVLQQRVGCLVFARAWVVVGPQDGANFLVQFGGEVADLAKKSSFVRERAEIGRKERARESEIEGGRERERGRERMRERDFKLHFKSPTAERRHVPCVRDGRDRTHAARSGRAGYARLRQLG